MPRRRQRRARKEACESDDAECFRGLRAVVKGDTWKGHSFGKDWVHAWLKLGEPFDVEDPAACGKAIGGKSEQKQRDSWKWYFGSAPWLQPILPSPLVSLCPAKTRAEKLPSPQPSTPAWPPPSSLSASVQPFVSAGPPAPQTGGKTSSDLGGVWKFETSTHWRRFAPEQNTRLDDAWKNHKEIVVFNAGLSNS